MNEQGTHIDLFSGIGGFALAARWAGFRTVAFCECEPYAQRVLRKHWPDVPIHDDVRTFPGAVYTGATILTGGIPCQPFSQCGKQRGCDDDRWLWPAMRDVVSSARPSWVILENVPGIAKMAVEICVSDMESLGYACALLLIPASGVGAPHRRRRAWIVAESLSTNANGFRPHRAEMHTDGQGYRVEFPDKQVGIVGPLVQKPIWNSVDARVLGVGNGLPNRVDRLRGIGNAIVPQIAAEIMRMIVEIEKQNMKYE
jgi:DNA (cytosine-5)-methyltransferase 1